jgi:hypothetical protein
LEGDCITINLDGEKEAFIPISSVFKNVQPIILETGKDCLIGNLSELQVFDGHIYVFDKYFAKSLFVFDMEGRFIRKIGNVGKGPGEYIQANDFTLDTENRFIYLSDRGNRVHKYQLDGTYINSITIPIPRSNINFIQYYNGRLYADVFPWEPDMADYMLLETDPDNGKILSRSLPIKYNKGWAELFFMGHSFFMSRLNSPPRYTQLFMDYIVSVDKEITPYIELKSKNLITDNDLKNLPETTYKTNLMEKLEPLQGRSKIFDVHNFVENENVIIFSYQTVIFNYFTVVYSKETGTVRIAEYLCNDLIFKHDKSGLYGRFIFFDAKGAYEILHTNMIDDFQESMRNNELLPGLEKAEQLMELNTESNPVIFYYEFKDAE